MFGAGVAGGLVIEAALVAQTWTRGRSFAYGLVAAMAIPVVMVLILVGMILTGGFNGVLRG